MEFADMGTKGLNTKTKTRLGFWDVTTMFEVGKLLQLTRDTRQYKLNIPGVWTSLRSLKASKRGTVLFFGHENYYHREGVATILQSGLKKSLFEWKPIVVE